MSWLEDKIKQWEDSNDVGWLKAQLEELADMVVEEKEKNLRIVRGEFGQICSHCGWESSTAGASWEELQAHIDSCEKHPLYSLRTALADSERKLTKVMNNIGGSPADALEWSEKVGKALFELDRLQQGAVESRLADAEARVEELRKTLVLLECYPRRSKGGEMSETFSNGKKVLIVDEPLPASLRHEYCTTLVPSPPQPQIFYDKRPRRRAQKKQWRGY